MENKIKQNNQQYNKELEDELEALEAQLERSDQQDDDQDNDNMSLDELERQIQEMSDDENVQKQQKQPIKQTKNWPFSVPLNKLQIIEKNFHGFELFFGEALQNEIKKLIPNFKKKLQDEDDAIDFLLFLEQKNGKLVAMQKTVEQKVINQEMDQENYLKCLKGFLAKNQSILQIVQSKKVGQFDEARIKKRIAIFQQEIQTVEQAIKEQNNEEEEIEEEVEEEEEQQQQKDNPKKSDIQKSETISNNEQISNKEEQIEQKEDKNLQSNEVYVYLKSKKTLLLNLLEYLQTHLQEERKNIIQKQKKYLEQIDNYLTQFNEGKKVVLTKQEIDVKFPNPKKSEIVGMTDQQKHDKVQKLAIEIKNDMNNIKKTNPKLFQSLTKYYQNFFQNLKQVQQSNAPFPKIEKKQVPISCKMLNKDLDRGDIALDFLKVTSPKPNRVFFLRFWIQYKGQEQGFETTYCQQGGKMNYSKVIQLDTLGLREKYLKDAILILHIFKRKFVAFHRHICRKQMTLESIVNYATKKMCVSFEYKEGKTLDVEFNIRLRKAISQTPKIDLELYSFVKTYPAFSLKGFRRGSTIKQNDQQNNRSRSRPSSLVDKKINTKQVQKDIAQEKTIQKQLKPQKSSVSKFLFPLMTDEEYNLLKVVVAKCKLNHAYLDYDTKVFCVSFLEQYKNDLEKQANQYNEDLDMDMMKKANERLIKADQYLNYLENNIESQKMSIESYKGMIEGFLKMDEQLKKVFEKMKQIKGITFVSNRIALFKKEIEQFENMPEEQLKNIDYQKLINKQIKKYK